MIGTGSYKATHSSSTLNFFLNCGLVYKSHNAAKSSGESDGTLVTIPVPFSIDIVVIGRAYTLSYFESGAFNGLPIRSYPVTYARQGYFPYSFVTS